MLPAWVCGSIGVIVGFGFVEGGPIVGGVAGVGVWVCCWWCWWCGCLGVLVVLLTWCVDAGKFGVLKKKHKKRIILKW